MVGPVGEGQHRSGTRSDRALSGQGGMNLLGLPHNTPQAETDCLPVLEEEIQGQGGQGWFLLRAVRETLVQASSSLPVPHCCLTGGHALHSFRPSSDRLPLTCLCSNFPFS